MLDVIRDVNTSEFLNGLKFSGMPNHELNLKVGTPVMSVTRLENHVLEAKILTGNNSSQKVLIPRMSHTSSDPRMSFKFERRQFPLIVSYAMTINKSQEQSFSHFGLFLKKPVFSHDQLYVVISRVRSRSVLKILICDKDSNNTCTTNVVYKEVFHNLYM